MMIPDKDLRKTAANRIFAMRVESETLKQFNDCLAQNGVTYGSLMPDAHVGYTAPIGSAIVTGGIIYPEWVGVDIGCGILSVPTSFHVDDIRKKKRNIFLDLVWKSSINNRMINPISMPRYLMASGLSKLGQAIFNGDDCFGFKQLGTLGSGNHFVEIGVDLKGMVWISVHSGSRGVGHKIASAHINLARQIHTTGPNAHPSFRIGTDEAAAYLTDMRWLLGYASVNRGRILREVLRWVGEHCKGVAFSNGAIESNHNHIEKTNQNYIHRKGCTQADKGEMVNIASNMRDGIYLCRGKGSPESVYSCSHGAGRYCSRKAVKKMLTVEGFKNDMKGIMCSTIEKFLDESPRAYKSIGTVLELQDDLIDVTGHITPIINVKK